MRRGAKTSFVNNNYFIWVSHEGTSPYATSSVILAAKLIGVPQGAGEPKEPLPHLVGAGQTSAEKH